MVRCRSLCIVVAAAALFVLVGALPAFAQCDAAPPPPGVSPIGGVVHTPVTVTLSASQADYTVLYTTNGSTPPGGSTYSAPLTFNRTTTLKAVQGCYNVWAGWRWGSVVTETYIVRAGTPVLSLGAGTHPIGTVMQVTSATPGASIRYRLDGQTPSDTDPEVPSGGTLMAGNFTLAVRAFYQDMEPSDVVTRTYAVADDYSRGAVAAGLRHSLALMRDGTVWTWGTNERAQLGYGERWRAGNVREVVIGSAPSPQRRSVTGLRTVAAGDEFTLGLRQDGTVWGWGSKTHGQLGEAPCEVGYPPASNNCVRPTRVAGLPDIVAIAAGGHHALALAADGTVWAWGNNNMGQLGDGTTTTRAAPARVLSLTGVVSISAGIEHSLALKADGTVWAWGSNSYGQLGDGASGTNRHTPVQILTLSNIRSISAGYEHSLAVAADGTLWAWGRNDFGQLGDGTQTPRSMPVSVLTGVTQAAGGRIHSAAIKADGTLWTWGSNSEGRLGDATYLLRTTPQAVPGVPRMQAVALAQHTLAIGLDGSLWSWGENSRGQLGDGTTISRSTGMEVFPADTVGRGLPVSEEISYVHTDAIGSVRMITSATGTVLARYDYLPFGTEWTTSSSLASTVKFAGGERDAETAAGGWNAHDYFGARSFQSQTGRFTSVDPGHVAGDVMDPQSWNGYAYARNNPLGFVDPLGLRPCSIKLTGADAKAAGVDHGSTVEGDCVDGQAGTGQLVLDYPRWILKELLAALTAQTPGVLGAPIGPPVGGLSRLALDTSAMLPTLTQTTIQSVLRSAAERLGPGAATRVSRALQSHASRSDSWLRQYAAGGNHAKNTVMGTKLIDEIMRTGTVSTKVHPAHGPIVQVRRHDGSGIVFTNSGTFIGFLERYTPR